MVSFKFFPCHGNKFWDKIDYNSAPVKDNCALFALTPIYAAARLYSLAVGQIPRSTERVFSSENKFVWHKALV